MNNLNFNIKKYQNNDKNNYASYKNNIIMKDKTKTNSSLSQSGFNKTINLINKTKSSKTKICNNDKKRFSSFIINKRYKQINMNCSKKGK